MKDLIIKSTELHDTFLGIKFILKGEDYQTGISIASLIRFAIMTNSKKFKSYKMAELTRACIEDAELIEKYIDHLRSGNRFLFMFQEEWDEMINETGKSGITLSLINQKVNN